MIRRFQFQSVNTNNPLSLSSSTRFCGISSGFFGKFKQVNYINTNVEVKNDILEVSRTAYVGLKSIPEEIKAPFPEIEPETKTIKAKTIDEIEITGECEDQSILPEIEEETPSISSEENHYSYLQPVEKHNVGSVPNDRKFLLEKYRGKLFLHFPKGTELINHFFLDSQTISWNQNTLLFLLLCLEEMNGANPPKVSVETFMEQSRKYGIKTANWQTSIKKNFQADFDQDTPVITYSKELLKSGELVSELEERFKAIVDKIQSCCESLSHSLKAMEKGNIYTVSQKQVLLTLAALSLNEQIALKDLYDILDHNGVSKANLIASLTSKTLIPLIQFDETRTFLSLSKNSLLFETLQKHKSLISNQITKNKSKLRVLDTRKNEPFIPLKKEEAIIAEHSRKIEPEYSTRIFAANGYASLFGEKHPRIFFHLPNHLMTDTFETRKSIIALALKLLSQRGETSLSFARIKELLKDNRLGIINLPRDLLKKPEFKCSPEKKCVSLVDLQSMDKQLLDISTYRVKKEDISEKMKQLLPVFEEAKKINNKDIILRSEFTNKCKEKKIAINLPRDLSRLFGFIETDRIYLAPEPVNQALEILKKDKKKQS